ncbi:MAG: hypothetical protein K9K67_07270 [Bacteriovoracaceae bacterium]|nr:hypothetical protein [Bacteriovoracaceae bacterium]
MSLLSNKKMDLIFLFLPGVLAIGGLKLLKIDSFSYTTLLIAAYYLSDAGHVYTTLFRYRFQKREELKEVLYPFIIFSALFYGLFTYSISSIWTLVIYATFIHNLKQSYGISAWYAKISNDLKSRYFKPLFYSLNIVSLLSFHFRSDFPISDIYPLKYIFLYPSPEILRALEISYVLILLALILERINNAKSFYSFTFPLVMSSLYFFSFFLSMNINEIFVPLVLSHGMAYVVLIKKSRQAIYQKNGIIVLIVVLILGGIADYYLMEKIIFYSINIFLHHVGRSLILGALFTHYYLDGILWKKDHPQASLIYGS